MARPADVRRRLTRPAAVLLSTLAAVLAAGPAVADALPDGDWHIPLADDPAAPLTHPESQRLADAVARYDELAGAGGFPRVPDGPMLSPGERNPRVPALRARLRATGDYAGTMGADPWLFDAGLRDAVLAFQARHGLPPTGRLDTRTLETANVPADARRDQLRATLERWRWLPRRLEDTRIWVNVAAGELTLVEAGEPALRMLTVVGHPDRPTPSLRSELLRVVFHPTWSVPAGIAVQDLLPLQQHDPGFFERQRIRVWRRDLEQDPAAIDWTRYGPGRFPFRLVQDAGPRNSLGRVKFVLDNPFDIYLHDTPATGFFQLRSRALSAGCVRVAEPLALADRVLAGDRDWAAGDTAARLEAGRTEVLNLKTRLPVYLVYLTAWVSGDGRVHFRPDLYGRDGPVVRALRKAERRAGVSPGGSPRSDLL